LVCVFVVLFVPMHGTNVKKVVVTVVVVVIVVSPATGKHL